MYIFEKEIPVFGQYTLSDEEFEDISINAESTEIIECQNCFTALSELESGEQVLKWVADKFEIVRNVRDKNNKCYADIKILNHEEETRIPQSLLFRTLPLFACHIPVLPVKIHMVRNPEVYGKDPRWQPRQRVCQVCPPRPG